MIVAAALPTPGVRRLLQALLLLGFLCLGLFAARPALADPPTRAGRVAEVIGEAWLFDAEASEWTRVSRNQTISEGDRLRTDERSRVSLRIGSSSLWLDERSDLEISQLDEGRVLLLLAKGDLGLRLRSQEAVSEYKVKTREGLFFAEREGLYRVEQMDRGSRGFALQGRLRFESDKGEGVLPVWLGDGEQAEFWWAGGPRTERQRVQGDGFIDWLTAQSRAEGDSLAAGISQRYVSPEMTGAEDLDRHGRWEQAPEYGALWIPTVVLSDWAPYRHGRWTWTRHWGWTWVDDAPWGFAPFHYGRWVHWGGRWCWSPGAYVARPVYAPALVAWVGGPAVSIGIGIGGGRPARPHYGWYPLAPREVYVPGYRHSPGYVQRLNNWRDRDPVTVQRPRSNREVGGAISYLPGQGGPVRGLPVNDTALPARQLTTLTAPPARQDLAGLLPQRPPAAEAQLPGARTAADLPWRTDSLGRRERPQREDGPQRGAPQREELPQRSGSREPGFSPPVQPAQPQAEAQLPQRGVFAAPQAAQPQQQQQPAWPNRQSEAPRPSERAWDRSPEQRLPQRPEQRMEQRQEQRQEQRMEQRMERPPESRPVERVRPPETQLPMRPPAESRPPPQQQPQAQPQPQRSEGPPQRGNGGNADGLPRRGREIER